MDNFSVFVSCQSGILFIYVYLRFDFPYDSFFLVNVLNLRPNKSLQFLVKVGAVMHFFFFGGGGAIIFLSAGKYVIQWYMQRPNFPYTKYGA